MNRKSCSQATSNNLLFITVYFTFTVLFMFPFTNKAVFKLKIIYSLKYLSYYQIKVKKIL